MKNQTVARKLQQRITNVKTTIERMNSSRRVESCCDFAITSTEDEDEDEDADRYEQLTFQAP